MRPNRFNSSVRICVASLLLLGSMSAQSRAESPAGWRTVSAEIRNSHVVPDGRTFTYGYANIVNIRDGRTGVLFSLTKPGSVTRFAIPTERLRELSPVVNKSWWNPIDFIKKLAKGIKDIVAGVKGLSESLSRIYNGIIEVMDALGLDTAQKIHTSLGGDALAKKAVLTYLDNVHDAGNLLPFNTPIAERFAYTHWRTVQSLPTAQRRAVWYQFAQSVIDREGY